MKPPSQPNLPHDPSPPALSSDSPSRLDQMLQHAPPKRRKDEILDVATRLFAERGYDGASISDVASAAGMRKASVFYHFSTKDALYEAALERLLVRVADALRAAYLAEGPFVERLEAAADVVTHVLADGPFTARLLLREAMDGSSPFRGKLVDRMISALERAAAFVEAGQEARVFVGGDAKHMVLTAVGAQFLPFAIGPIIERFVGTEPFDAGFIERRRAEVRREVRSLIVCPAP